MRDSNFVRREILFDRIYSKSFVADVGKWIAALMRFYYSRLEGIRNRILLPSLIGSPGIGFRTLCNEARFELLKHINEHEGLYIPDLTG